MAADPIYSPKVSVLGAFGMKPKNHLPKGPLPEAVFLNPGPQGLVSCLMVPCS